MERRQGVVRSSHHGRPAFLAAILLPVVLAAGSLLPVSPALALVLSPSTEKPPEFTNPEPLIRNARDLLKLYGMDENRLSGVSDNRPLEDDQYELMLRMMFSVRRFSLADQRRYVKPTAMAQWVKAVPENRGELFSVRGKVLRVTAEKPATQVAERFELPLFYRCDVDCGEGVQAVVYALNVPKAWQELTSESALNERVGANAFLLRSIDVAGKLQPVLLTQRLSWYPATMLGDMEGDAGLFESVENNMPMQSSDSACFYDMLAACGKVGTRQLLRAAPKEFVIESLFSRRDKQTKKIVDPPTERGELLALTGTAQRAVLVRIEDPDTIAAYGFDHYYELEIWHANAQGNPIVFCVRKLPDGMPLGERIAIDVQLAGFFFKTWAYPIGRKASATDDKTRYQIAPLLIGREPLLLPREEKNPWLQIAGGCLFAVAVVGAWIGVIWSSREDKAFHNRVIRRVVIEGPADVSVAILTDLDRGSLNFHNYHDEAPLLSKPDDDAGLPEIDTSERKPNEGGNST